MAHDLSAPWAEVVAGVSYPMSVDKLVAQPDDGWTYELVEGRLVRTPPTGIGRSGMGVTLAAAIYSFVRQHQLGHVSGVDGEYILSNPGEPDTALAPDVAFVRADRLPQRDSPEWDRPWRLAPDLAVEIASPNQYHPEMAAKALVYLGAGVRLVWVVWLRQKQVDIWRPSAEQPIATLNVGDSLDGVDVLPGFAYPLADLFS